MDVRALPWGLVAALGALGGGVLAILSVLGETGPNVEFWLWMALYFVVWVPVLTVKRVAHPFWSGLVTSAVSGVVYGLIEFAFVGVYLENNPDVAAEWTGTAEPLIGLYGLAFAVAAGLAFGVVVGGVAWAVRRWGTKDLPTAPAS